MWGRTLLLGVVLAAALTGCGQQQESRATVTASPSLTPSETPPSQSATPRVVGTAATGLRAPWGIAFLPNGEALVTERDSRRVLSIRDGRVREVGTIDARPEGEAGLLGVAVSPDFGTNHRVFFYATTGSDNRVLRAQLSGGRLTAVTPILTGIPKGFVHDGGRLVFGPDGVLYVSTGETGEPELAQDPHSLAGKILRIDEDGKPFDGNDPVWTLGHRNVQGLAFDDREQLWASEFGEQTWDELNLIRQGNNYGWPRVEGRGEQTEFTNPAVVWRPEDASPSGLAYADGNLWMASLRGTRLWQIPVTADGVGKPKAHFTGRYGRLRAVVRAPNGNLWVGTSNHDGRGDPKPGDDRILIVRP